MELLHEERKYQQTTGKASHEPQSGAAAEQHSGTDARPQDMPGTTPNGLSLPFLARFIRERCVLPFHVGSARPEEIEAEIRRS